MKSTDRAPVEALLVAAGLLDAAVLVDAWDEAMSHPDVVSAGYAGFKVSAADSSWLERRARDIVEARTDLSWPETEHVVFVVSDAARAVISRQHLSAEQYEVSPTACAAPGCLYRHNSNLAAAKLGGARTLKNPDVSGDLDSWMAGPSVRQPHDPRPLRDNEMAICVVVTAGGGDQEVQSWPIRQDQNKNSRQCREKSVPPS